MAVRPKLGEYTAEKEIGTGALEKSYDYLKTSDPTAYYYNKLKHEKNEFLRDDMWNEAIRRGETQILANLLSERQKISKGKEYSEAYKDLSAEGLYNLGIDALSKWESYGNTADYDGYMLALSIPTLDDSVKKPRTTDDGTYTFGDFTDREWANYVLENQFTYYDNLIIDEQKKNQNWLQQGWNTIVSLGGNIAVGLTNFVGDIYNIGEGLLNLIFNEGGDDDLGSRFLYAFSNDPENPLAQEMHEFHRRNLLMFGQEAIDTMTGEVTGFGKYWNGITESVGYMLPSILLNIALPGSGTPVFYAGIFSGNIKDTVTRAADAKISYKDLNAGSVIINAGLKAAGQLVIEKLLGKILGASGLDKLIGTSTTVTKAGSKIAEEALATGWKAAGITASRVIKDMAKEGLEEALQDLSDGIIDIVFGAGGSELDKLYLERGQETTTWQNISDAFVMGALTTAMVGSFTGVFKSRAILTGEDGKTYKAGLFQSLNFRNALATMNEWNNTVNDKKANTKAKTEAALNLSKVVSLLGSFTNNIGAVRAVRANNILNQMINVQATDAHIDNWLKTSYDNNYYNEFVSAYNNIVNQYKDGKNAKNKESIFSKVKTAISKVSAKLQKAKVTKTKSIITQDSTIEETNLSEDSLTRLKQVMKGLGAEVLIGTDGAIVTEADGVAFINNELINNTDSIIQGTTYDKVIDGVVDNMTSEQKEFLTEQYSKIVPSDEVTLEAAILALIRDNTFYTKLLLFSSDKKSNNTAISFLTNIYEIVKNRTIELEAKGEITKAAIKALLDRVLSTMRRGLVSYATKYVNYDVNQLSDEVFPKELKDAVNNHQNVIYTKLVNTGLETSKNNKFVTPRDLESYNRELDKFSEYVDKEIIDTLKRKVRSNKKVERIEAWATLGILPKLANINYDETKVIMLPVVEDSDLVLVEEYSAKLSDMFGTSFTDIAKGIIDPNNFSEELISFIAQSPEYNLTTEIDRIELIRELVFNISNGQFTIDENFNFINVLTKEQFLKSKYLTENGLNKLKEDIKSGNIKVLSDISKLKLPNKLKNTRIVYNPNVTNIPGRYDNVNNIIDLFSLFNISTILHEATHATQSYLISDKVIIAGGDSEAIWSALSQEDKTDISNYLETNFPDLFKILKNTYGTKFKTAKSMMYLMLEGELRANAISSVISPICGFTYENNRQILVSPLKDKKWNLSYKSTPIKQEIKKIETQAPLSIDKDTIIKRPVVIDKETNERVKKAIRPLIVDEKTKLAEVARIKKAVLYKGTGTKDIKSFDNTKGKNIRIVSNAIWFSDNANVAQTYMRDIESIDIPTLYGANLDFDNPLVIDAKGQTFSQIQRGLTSDEVAAFAEYNNYDSLIILNIIDKGTYYKNVTDIANSRKPSTDVVVFDNKNINNLKQKVYDKKYTKISDLTVDIDSDIFIKGIKPKEGTKLKSYDTTIKSDQLEDIRTNIDTAKAFDKMLGKTRYITNKRANLSNLKYFVKKGVPIQMHPGIADFIEGTTNEFEKLPIILKNKIKNGTLNKFNLLDYLATANNIDDFTFKSIAKYIFRNSEVEKITYKDMKRLFNQIEELATISYLTKYPDKQMTPTELFNKLKVAWNKLEKEDKEFTKKYKDASEHSISIFVNDKKSEAHADTSQLQIAFFRIYDGSLKSIRDLNNYGKLISAMQDPEILDLARYDEGTLIESGGTWNWTDSQKAATIAYKYDEAKEILNELSREDKLEIIKDYLINSTSAKLAKQSFTKEQQLQIAKGLQERLDKIEEASDAEIDKRYLMIIANEGTASTMADKPSEAISKLPLEKQEPSKKNIKDQLRKLGKTITKRIAGLKYRYNLLSEEVKKYIDSKTYTLNDEYKSLTIEQLTNILPMFQEAAKVLKSRITNTEIEARIKAEVEKRVAKFAKKLKGLKEDKTAKKTIREKIEVKYTTKIINQEFVINSPIELTKNDNPDIMTADKLVHAMLNTNWQKYTDSEVKGVDTKDAKSVAAIKDFFTQNTDTLLSADLNTIEEVSRWFLNTTLNNASDEDFRQFNIIKQYFLEYVLTYSKTNKIYEQINANLKQQIDNWVEKNASLGGTSLAIHNNMLNIQDPLRNMRSADMIIDGIKIEGENKEKLFEAIESGDIKYINEIIREITEYVESNKTAKRSFARKIVSFRSMSMLSGPLTWLRNRVSNIVLKRLNKLSSLLGNKMFKGKSQQGQLKLTAQITPEIQKYIVNNFVDNEFFDKIVSNISKYNPSDIQSMKQTDLGVATKESVLAQLVIKSMYNEYYNKNTFKSKFMNQIHNNLMKVMSDDTYVREAAIRYFGKLLAENNRQLDQGITDEVMNDFAKALGLALSDYMHSENFFNKWENILAEKSEAGWFLYKTILPFASASWNWFKAMIKMSPIGLARSIINITTLEKRIAKAEQLWQEGKTQISPELTEYIARRDLGQGVIGTIAFILGVALAAIGFIQLDDDDYGNPKLTVGPLKIDISSIFGSSSILAGAALVTGFKDEGSFNEALNRTLDVMLDNFPIMQILELDMYSNGSWDIITSTAESTALSFIPNFISYIAGATYSSNVKKDTFWRRAIAKIPVLANVLPKKVDPYTGSTGSYIDALNRIIPYLSIKVASDNERKTTELGLNKTMLRGQYSINGEEFNVTGKDLDTINKLYGQWNAADLTKFYDNKMKVEVKVGNTYKVMSYNQMDDIQRKAAVQTIMSNNAELAKIYAWTIAGNKYYASETIYNKLKKNGIHKNVYRGSQGFVKKK